MANQAFICDALRTPFGRYAGSLAPVLPDDLLAVPIRALAERNANINWAVYIVAELTPGTGVLYIDDVRVGEKK